VVSDVAGRVVDFERCGFIAIRAAKPISEQDGQSHSQTMASHEFFGIAVFGATSWSKHRCPAQWTVGVIPLGPNRNDQNETDNRDAGAGHGQMEIAEQHGLYQQACGDWCEQANEKQ